MGERSEPIVRLQDVSKHFGAIHALNRVSIEIGAGEVVGLMGDNGAGKSTLVKILAGNYPPTSGSYFIDGKPVHLANPAEARGYGIEVVYQDLALCNNLTAAANVFLGREIMRGSGFFRWLDHKAMAKRAEVLFRELQSETRSRDLVERMSGGQRQAVAIARTRLADAKLVLMDEPTAAISAAGCSSAHVDQTATRSGALGGPDQPPHARRLRLLRTRGCAAARTEGR